MAPEPPELELAVRPPPPPKPVKPRAKPQEEAPLELAVDPRELVAQRAAESHGGPGYGLPGYGAGAPAAARGPAAAASAPVLRGAPASIPGPPRALAAPPRAPYGAPPVPGAHAAAGVADLDMDARVLADFGEPPRTWILAPLYAWRVLRRQRELRAALVGRRTESEHAATQLDDALVAFTERVRPVAEKHQTYAVALEDLARAEDVLRSRDRVLGAEQDAQKERLSQVDGRMSKLEAELAQAHVEERVAATELSGAQGALAREEAKLKRAEAELKAALARVGGGAGG